MTGLGVKAGALFLGAILSFSGVPTGPGTLAVRTVISSGHHGAVLTVGREHVAVLLSPQGK